MRYAMLAYFRCFSYVTTAAIFRRYAATLLLLTSPTPFHMADAATTLIFAAVTALFR